MTRVGVLGRSVLPLGGYLVEVGGELGQVVTALAHVVVRDDHLPPRAKGRHRATGARRSRHGLACLALVQQSPDLGLGAPDLARLPGIHSHEQAFR